MKNRLNTKEITTDVLIIGGGTAGCYAALVLSEQKAGRVLIAEKANIRRSGCLAAGVNAINAYIVKGRKPQDYVDYATKDAAGIVRQDLLLTAAENGLDPYRYLLWVLQNAPQLSETDETWAEKLFPARAPKECYMPHK